MWARVHGGCLWTRHGSGVCYFIHIPLARTLSYGHTLLQGTLGNVFYLGAQEEEEIRMIHFD